MKGVNRLRKVARAKNLKHGHLCEVEGGGDCLARISVQTVKLIPAAHKLLAHLFMTRQPDSGSISAI